MRLDSGGSAEQIDNAYLGLGTINRKWGVPGGWGLSWADFGRPELHPNF